MDWSKRSYYEWSRYNFKSVRKTDNYETYLKFITPINSSSKLNFNEEEVKKFCLTEHLSSMKFIRTKSLMLGTKADINKEFSDEEFDRNLASEEIKLANMSPTTSFILF